MHSTVCSKKLYLVAWKDAIGDSSWTTEEEAKKTTTYPVTTVGWLIHWDEEKIILCSDIADDNKGVAGVAVIPNDWITNIYELIF